MTETYEGKVCRHCGGTRRLRSDRHCVRREHERYGTDPMRRLMQTLRSTWNKRRRLTAAHEQEAA